MKFKKSFLTLCILIFLFGIVCVSASDINDTVTAEEEPQIVEQADDGLIESAQEDLLSEDDGTFTALQRLIDNSAKDSTITLDKDYAYDEGFSTRGIVVDKNLTIDGNGHTLDGLSKSRIFLINGKVINPYTVTLKNIKFKNGHTDLYGGAIFNFGNAVVDNCEFSHNYAKYCGGAIGSIGLFEYKNSKFNANIADGDGGAIFTLSIRGTLSYLINETMDVGIHNFMDYIRNNFTLQYATEKISNCVFTNNVAKGTGGGAVYAYGNIDIKSSKFTSNSGGLKGGAVFANKDLFISGSTFTGNKVSTYGGAVYFKCHDLKSGVPKYYSNSITGCDFTKNTASKGGAIYAFRTSSSDTTHCAKAVKCTFTANKASQGRDIYGGTHSKCVFNYLKLTLKKVKVKKSAKKLVLTAKLTKGKTLIKGKKITFKFKGKTYKAKTNKKGIAKVTIKKSVLKKLKVGKKVKYQAKYGKLIKKVTVKVKK